MGKMGGEWGFGRREWKAGRGERRGSYSFVNKRNHTRLGWTGGRLSSSIKPSDLSAEKATFRCRVVSWPGGGMGLGTGWLRFVGFCGLAVFFSIECATAQTTAPNEWIWVGGSTSFDQVGVYGTLGTPEAA